MSAATGTGQSDVTYKAAFNVEECEVTVVRDVRAGVSGPFGDFPADDLQAAERALFDAGYLVASPWGELTVTGSRWCTLTLMV